MLSELACDRYISQSTDWRLLFNASRAGEDSQKNYWCKILACAEQEARSVDDLAFLLVLILFFYRIKKDHNADSQG